MALAVATVFSAGVAAQEPPAPTLEEAFARAPGYELGQSRLALTVIADAVSNGLIRRPELEGRLVALLEDPSATRDCRGFACRQLARIGTSACVPALARLLSRTDENQGGLASLLL